VRVEGAGGPLLCDPFAGRPLGPDGLRALHARVGGEGDPDPHLLAPSSKTQILVRMLNNLRRIYGSRGEHASLRHVLECMHVLTPRDPSVEHDLEALAALGGGSTSTN
jgi:regulator of sirC expression with transglutaminase-like and TPR domain